MAKKVIIKILSDLGRVCSIDARAPDKESAYPGKPGEYKAIGREYVLYPSRIPGGM